MDVIGIICEYNPFHNGHLYHINKIKEMYPDSTIILVMSGNITQRGDLSVINKWDKTDIALHYGIDLVIELPFIYATQSADIFCYASITILNYLKVNKIVFGSESNNIEFITKLAETQLNNDDYNNKIQNYLKEGLNYPTALAKSLEDITNINIKTPNDILAIGYVREILKNNYDITPITIKRTSDYNSKELSDVISSATSIRESIKKNIEISKYVPNYSLKFINNIFIDMYFDLIKYKIISEINNLDKYQSVDENIIPRIKKYIYTSNSLDEFILNIKTKNYTYNRIKRMIIHILFSITKEEIINNNKINYIRILGFNKKGKQYLNKIKKEINIPLITKYDEQYLSIESRITNILNIKLNNNFEYEYKPIIKED